MDLGSITAAFGSLKAAGDLAKSFVSLHATAEVQAKAIELNHKIIEAQQQVMTAQATQTALIGQVGDLRSEIARMERWDVEKQRYELAQPFPGCMVYALKKAMSGGQTAHYLCASCFQKRQTSILQGRENPKKAGTGGIPHASYYCHACETEAFTRWVNPPTPEYFEDIKPPE